MTREDTIRMFHEAGEAAGWKPGVGNALVINYLAHFAALAAAAEREACAVTAWSAGMDAHNAVRGLPCDARDVGSKAAAAIRARGKPATREERRAHDERYLRATVEQTRTGRFA